MFNPLSRPGVRACLAILALASAFPAVAADMVRFQFDSSVSAEDRAIWQPRFQEAADRWNNVITGYEGGYNGNGVTFTVQLSNDGPSYLAYAGPTDVVRFGDRYYTKTAVISVNTYYNDSYYNNPQYGYLDTLMHEMDHGIGFGTLWTANNLYVDGTGRYTGKHALAAYRMEFNQRNAAYVPVELEGGSGTADGHWDQGPGITPLGLPSIHDGYENLKPAGGVLDNPDFYLDVLGGTEQGVGQVFLSHTTVAALRDLGYTVNETYPNEPAIPVPGVPTGSPGGSSSAPLPQMRNHPLAGYRIAATEGAYGCMNSLSARMDQVFSGRPIPQGAEGDFGVFGGEVARSGGAAASYDLSRASAQDDFEVMSETAAPARNASGFFATGSYTDITRDADGIDLGVDGQGSEAVFGYDRQVGDDWILGVAFTYQQATWDTSNSQNTTETEGFGGMFYGRWRDVDGFFLGFSGGYRRLTLDTENRIQVGFPTPTTMVTTGSTHSDQLMASIRMGQDYVAAPGCVLTPYAELGMVYSSMAAYTETGDIPLAFGSTTNTNVRGALGVNWSQWFAPVGSTTFGYHAGASVRRQLSDGSSDLLASDATTGSATSLVVMLAPNKTTGVFNGGLDLKVKNVTAFIDGNYGFASGSRQVGISAGARIDF